MEKHFKFYKKKKAMTGKCTQRDTQEWAEQYMCWRETNLQADSQVDPGAEGSADCARRQAEVFEELGEGLRESKTRPLLCYHHTASHARQIQTPRL